MELSDLRIGLALGGGGARGAFTVGVLDALSELTDLTSFPVVAGTSTGALVATLVCNEDFPALRYFYTEVETEDIINHEHPIVASLLGDAAAAGAAALLGNQSVFDAGGLARLIDRYADMDLAKRRRDACHLILATVSLQSGELVLFSNRRHAASTLRKALLASASEPVFMPPVVLQARGRRDQYVDGGVREVLPLAPVLQASDELDAVVAISTNPLGPKLQEGHLEDLTGILGRTVELFVTEVQRNDYEGARRVNALLRIIENAERHLGSDELFDGVDEDLVSWLGERRSVPILHVGPEEHIPVSSLDFSRDVMTRLMTRGRRRGARILRPFLRRLVRETT